MNNFTIIDKKELSNDFKKKYLNQISNISKTLANDYEAYLYEQKNIGRNKALFVYVLRDSYGILHLLLIDENEKLLSSLEIAGTNCGGVFEKDNGLVEWCGDRYSLFDNDSIFSTILVKETTNGYEDNAAKSIDSNVVKYKINNNNGIIQKLEERIYHYDIMK